MNEIKFSDWANFTPKQKLASKVAEEHRYTLFGGSAGPGKSYWLRKFTVKQLINWYMKTGIKGIRAGIFCEDYPTLKDRQISKVKVEFPEWLGKLADTSIDGLCFKLNESFGGGIIVFRNLDDPSKYLSSEFALIGIDELTMNDESVFDMLRMRLRWTGIEDTKFIGATNPGSKGHLWVKQKWIDRKFSPDEKEPEEFAYIPALPTDNPHLAKSYIQALQSLPERMRKAYLEGNWDVFEGQFFSEFDRNVHVVEPFEIPYSWKKYRSIDVSGRHGWTACGWYAVDTDGNIFKYREHYVTGLDSDEHAREIARRSEGEKYQYTVMDNSAWAKIGLPESIAEVYMKNGVTGLLPCSKDRVAGWDIMHQFLRWDDNTPPKLKIFKTCPNTIETIPAQVYDDKNPNDIDRNSTTDHIPDEVRYLLQTLRGSKSVDGSTIKTKSYVEQRLEELNKQGILRKR